MKDVIGQTISKNSWVVFPRRHQYGSNALRFAQITHVDLQSKKINFKYKTSYGNRKYDYVYYRGNDDYFVVVPEWRVPESEITIIKRKR